MQPMKRRLVRGQTLNLVARSLARNVKNPMSDSVSGLSKSVRHHAPRSNEIWGSAANGVSDPLQRQLVPGSRIQKCLGYDDMPDIIPGAQSRCRDFHMKVRFRLKGNEFSTSERLERSGALHLNNALGTCLWKPDIRSGGLKPSVACLGFIGTVRSLHTEIRGEENLVDGKSEKVANVRKVRSTARAKASSASLEKRQRAVGRVASTTAPRTSPVDGEASNCVSGTEKETEFGSRTGREEERVTLGGLDASAELRRGDHGETTEKGFEARGQIVRTILPPDRLNHSQYVTVGEDVETSRRSSAQAMALLRAALDEAEDETEDGKVEAELQRSLRIGIVGAPNAGKSLLTNQLVGTRVSAVSRKTNTTHREHLGVHTKGDSQLLYYDTPGLHLDIEGSPLRVDAQHRVRNAWEIVDFCEALVVLVDAERQIRRPDKRVQRLVEKLGKEEGNGAQKRVLCLNKVDIIEEKRSLLPLAKQFEDLLGYDRIFMISGLTGSGVKDVQDYLVNQAVLRPWDEDPELKDHRDVALEVVREQVFEHLHEELPHTTKQKLVSWKVLKDGSTRIQQLLSVPKKEHQKILVGKNGAVIGDIGIKARKELSEILGTNVHLVLDVKVMSASSMSADQ